MTRLLALKVELVADVPTGDFGEMTAAIKESAEIQRQVLARLRRVAMGKRWTMRIYTTEEPILITVLGDKEEKK